ncbi:MAG: hypothetical protein WCH04_09810 [Gammaproteobacteria bacterium]
MLKINDLGTEKELDQEAMKELRGGQYTKGDGVTVGSNKTLMGALEEWAYYRFWY